MNPNNIPDDYVKMEQHVCPVCGVKHSHDCGILMHKRLRSIPEEQTVTGWGMCEEHDSLRKKGYIALVGLNGDPTGDDGKVSDINDAADYRTGETMHVAEDAFKGMFNCNPPENGFSFIEQGVIDQIKTDHPEAVTDDVKEILGEGEDESK
jgi:hypothetical protein